MFWIHSASEEGEGIKLFLSSTSSAFGVELLSGPFLLAGGEVGEAWVIKGPFYLLKHLDGNIQIQKEGINDARHWRWEAAVVRIEDAHHAHDIAGDGELGERVPEERGPTAPGVLLPPLTVLGPRALLCSRRLLRRIPRAAQALRLGEVPFRVKPEVGSSWLLFHYENQS